MKDGVKKNFIYQTIYEVLIIILPLLTSPYIARVLGAENLGIYSLTYSVAYLFQVGCALGIKYHGTRIIASCRNNQQELNRKFSELFFVHFIISVLIFILYIIYVAFFVKENKVISYIQMINVLSALIDISWFFFGIEKFKVTATSNSIIKIITVICIFCFVKKSSDLYIYTLIMSLGLLASQLVLWLHAQKYVKLVKVNFKSIISHLKPLCVLFIPVLAFSMFNNMGKIILGIFDTKTAVGFYENATKVINIPLTVVFSFSTVMLPRISSLNSSKDYKKTNEYIEYSFKYMEWLAIGMAFGLFSVANNFSIIFWGGNFAACGNLMKILAFTIPFSTYSSIVRTQYLMPKRKDNIYTTIMIIGAIINILLDCILVKKMGGIGIALGTLISEFLVMFLQIVFTKKELNHTIYIKSFIYFFIPGIIMALILYILERLLDITILNLILEILLGGLIYLIISLVYFKITNDKVLNDLLSKLKKLR